MKIVTYNIQFGLGKDGHIDLKRIANEVNGADIIALQEVERFWERSGNTDQPVQIAKILEKYYWAYGPYFDVDASTVSSDGRVKNVRRQFGNMILSKAPILSTRLFPLPKSALRHRHNMVAGIFEGVINFQNEGAIRIYNAHLGARSQHDRVLQINSIRKTIQSAPTEGGAWTGPQVCTEHRSPSQNLWKENSTPPPMPKPFVLLGDFNLETQAPEYEHLVGPKDGELGRVSIADVFIDTWVATGHAEDLGCTYTENTASGETRPTRIDFAFIDESLKTRILTARIDENARGSDHQPYWIEIDLR